MNSNVKLLEPNVQWSARLSLCAQLDAALTWNERVLDGARSNYFLDGVACAFSWLGGYSCRIERTGWKKEGAGARGDRTDFILLAMQTDRRVQRQVPVRFLRCLLFLWSAPVATGCNSCKLSIEKLSFPFYRENFVWCLELKWWPIIP